MADSGIGLEPQQPPAQPAPADDKITLTRAEYEGLKRESAEARESERFWASRAQANGTAPQPAAAQVADDTPDPSEFIDPTEQAAGIEGDTPEQMINELAANGVGALAKRGFITAKDAHRIAVEAALKVVPEMIGRERQKMGTDQQIKSEFPELWDDKSELFKETAKHYQEAVAMDPEAIKRPATLLLAARAARATLGRRAPAADEYDDGREREEDRRARAAAQDSRSNGRQHVEDNDMMGPEAKEVARLMGVTPQEFQASRKELGTRARRR